MKDHRKNIIDILEVIKKRDFSKNDRWKVRAYDNVIRQLKARSEPVHIMEDLDGITGIGEKIRAKIKEIIETGDLQQVHNITEEVNVVAELSKIFGIGPIRGRELYEKHNIKGIDDLKNQPELLNDKQKIGLKYYEDFEKRIPKTEMDKHSIVIKEKINDIDPGLIVEIMGSYRRGDKDSGDIDVLITHKDDPENYTDIFEKVVQSLSDEYYLIDTFAKGTKKYNGVCRLKRHKFNRRIDIMYTRAKEFPFALLYFTGSQDFNVKLRTYALEHGYSLNEYGLKLLSGENKGSLVEIDFKTEEAVFNFLKLKFVPPTKRSYANLSDYYLD